MVHLNLKPYQCENCNKYFSKQSNLKAHVARVHLKMKPPKKYICTECDTAFDDVRKLECHTNRIHLKIRPYKCEQCKLAFVVESELKGHVNRVHLKVEPILRLHIVDITKFFVVWTDSLLQKKEFVCQTSLYLSL